MPRLSIVVLPFANLGNDPSQQYFADGITEDLTTDLSGLAHMLVISAGTAFTYRDQPIKVKQIGRELGIRYVLEGSVQRSGGKMRINAQLVDAETDTHLWAEQFDGDSGDLFALQTEITRRIAAALNVELIAKEAARPAEHPDALDYILRGRAAYKNGITRDTFSRAIAMYEHALVIEPQSVEARTSLGQALADRVNAGMSNSRAADVARAKDLIEESLAISPGSWPAHFARGQLLRTENRCDEAIPQFEMVIASNPNYANAFFALGVCKLWTGSIDQAIALEETAIRLSPRDPAVYNRYLTIGMAQLLRSHTDEAIVALERARTLNPESPFPLGWLAAAYGLKGDRARAAAELAEAQRLADRGAHYTIARLTYRWGGPNIRSLFEATYLAGLRKAGVPEE